MTTGLAPVYGLDHSHPQSPGFQGALVRPTEDFGRDVNRGKGDDRADPLSGEQTHQRIERGVFRFNG